jgi:glycosyltransferase involved in cell wall biosynthesis
MARAIKRVCKLPKDEWERLSDAAHRTATSYSWDDATDRFEAALHAAV